MTSASSRAQSNSNNQWFHDQYIKGIGGSQGYTTSVSGPQDWQKGGFGSHAEFNDYNQSLRDAELGGIRQDQTNKQRLLDAVLGGGGSGSVSGSFGLGDYRERANALVDQMGNSDRLRIGRDFEATAQGSLANLSDRGFGGSSLSQNISLGTEREKQQALTGLEDSMLGRRLGVEESYFNQQANLIQSLLGGIFN